MDKIDKMMRRKEIEELIARSKQENKELDEFLDRLRLMTQENDNADEEEDDR